MKSRVTATYQIVDYCGVYADDVPCGMDVSRPLAIVAKANGEIEGYVQGFIVGNVLYVHKSLVYSYFRGKGIGYELYERLFIEAARRGVEFVAGSAHTEKAARVHRALKRDYGTDYTAKVYADDGDGNVTDWGEYEYSLTPFRRGKRR